MPELKLKRNINHLTKRHAGQFTGNRWGSDAQTEGVSCSTGYRQGSCPPAVQFSTGGEWCPHSPCSASFPHGSPSSPPHLHSSGTTKFTVTLEPLQGPASRESPGQQRVPRGSCQRSGSLDWGDPGVTGAP